MNYLFFILLTIVISCKTPSFKGDEILVDKVNISFGTNNSDSTQYRYFKIIFNDSRKYFKDSNMHFMEYSYVKYSLIPNLKIPIGYKKISKYDILKLNLKYAKDEDNKRITFWGPPNDNKPGSYLAVFVFENDLIINGYLPDSCFIK